MFKPIGITAFWTLIGQRINYCCSCLKFTEEQHNEGNRWPTHTHTLNHYATTANRLLPPVSCPARERREVKVNHNVNSKLLQRRDFACATSNHCYSRKEQILKTHSLVISTRPTPLAPHATNTDTDTNKQKARTSHQ